MVSITWCLIKFLLNIIETDKPKSRSETPSFKLCEKLQIYYIVTFMLKRFMLNHLMVTSILLKKAIEGHS